MQLCLVSFDTDRSFTPPASAGHFLTLNPIKGEKTMNENAELANGRWAMIGIMAALGSYAFTGQIIPGIF